MNNFLKNEQRSESFSYLISQNLPCPQWLDHLISQPWTPQASRLVDRWLWYLQVEGLEGVNHD
jgi:hypothetical protein